MELCRALLNFRRSGKPLQLILNGEKMWNHNAGFADLFTPFFREGRTSEISAFLVERTYPAFSVGRRHKMGALPWLVYLSHTFSRLPKSHSRIC